MIDRLHLAGYHFLSDIGIFGMSVLMPQEWLSADTLGFIDPFEIAVWNGYIAILKYSHVRISNEDDCLIWHLSKTGKYSPKVGYAELIYREVDSNWH